MSTAIITGSITAVAYKERKSIAEQLLGATTIVIVDTSGSMDIRDSRGKRRRYDVACEELAKLQADNPGKLAVVSFSNSAYFCPGGVPIFLGGDTDLARALQFVRSWDGTGLAFIVVSDGEPNDEQAALREAQTFKSPISTVYVGPETDRSGALFLRRLAEMSGGKHATADRVKELAETVKPMLTSS